VLLATPVAINLPPLAAQALTDYAGLPLILAAEPATILACTGRPYPCLPRQQLQAIASGCLQLSQGCDAADTLGFLLPQRSSYWPNSNTRTLPLALVAGPTLGATSPITSTRLGSLTVVSPSPPARSFKCLPLAPSSQGDLWRPAQLHCPLDVYQSFPAFGHFQQTRAPLYPYDSWSAFNTGHESRITETAPSPYACDLFHNPAPHCTSSLRSCPSFFGFGLNWLSLTSSPRPVVRDPLHFASS